MRRRVLGIGLAVTAVAATLGASAGVASASQAAAHSRIVLAPNHHPSAKPGGGGRPGGGGTVWPGWSSTNWSGYAVTHATPYSSASGTWTVPSVARTKSSTYSAAWVGVGGFNDATLIQTGTEQDWVNGKAVYAAWWTTDAQGYAETSFSQPITVSPGDSINASVTQNSATTWTITLTDSKTHQTGSQTVTNYQNSGLSAEWIMEAPGIGGRQSTIANYSTFPFTASRVNGSSRPRFVEADGGILVQKSTVTSIPSKPNTQGDAFNMAHGASQPTAP